jgi:outer membrane protein assembly factor BamB
VGADGTPAAERDVLFCASEDGCLYALTERDGKLLWKVNSGAPIRLTPIVAGRRLVAVNSDGRVLALDARSGQEVWGQDLGALAGGGPALVGRRVVVPLRQGRLVGLSADTGELEWAAGLPAQIEATPIAVEGGTVYVGSTEGHLYAVDSAEGGVKWDFATGGPISASPSVAHGRLVCGSHDGAIYAFGGSPPADGVATHSVGSGDRVVSAKPAPIDALPKPPPVPVLQATSARPPAPTGALSRPPATLPPSTPAVISVPQPAPTASTGSDLQLTLVSEPADASELPIQLTNSRETRVAWGSTAPSADVDGVPVLNRDGQIEVLKAFGEDGTYPVTMTTGTGTRDERISCRLVIVDTGPEPTARRDVAFSPDGDGVGDTIALRAAASSAGSSVASRTVGIRDAQGRVLRTWSAPSDGETTFVWDGKDGAGNRVASGIYEVIYAAKDAQGRTVQMKQRILLQRAGERLAAN